MSSESKRPTIFGPVPPYKAHFELWNRAYPERAVVHGVEAANIARPLVASEAPPLVTSEPTASELGIDHAEAMLSASWQGVDERIDNAQLTEEPEVASNEASDDMVLALAEEQPEPAIQPELSMTDIEATLSAGPEDIAQELAAVPEVASNEASDDMVLALAEEQLAAPQSVPGLATELELSIADIEAPLSAAGSENIAYELEAEPTWEPPSDEAQLPMPAELEIIVVASEEVAEELAAHQLETFEPTSGPESPSLIFPLSELELSLDDTEPHSVAPQEPEAQPPPIAPPMTEEAAAPEIASEFAPHFAIDDADAPPMRNGRGARATSVLSTAPFVRRVADESAPVRLTDKQLIIAAVATSAVLAVLAMRPWRYFEAPSPPRQNLATQSLAKPAIAPAQIAKASPAKPIAMPSVAAPSKPAASLPALALAPPHSQQSNASSVVSAIRPPVTAASHKPRRKPAPIVSSVEAPVPGAPEPGSPGPVHAQAETLGASLQSQMTREGYPNLGVTVTDADDVYLVGAFPSQAERDRAIAMVRAHRSVRDIYFAGSVWYANRPEQPANAEDMETHLPAVRSSSPESAPPRQPSAEPTDYFPITAADVTPAPPPEVPTPAAAASTAMPDAAQSHADLWPLRHSNDSH